MAKETTLKVIQALDNFNADFGKAWTFGENWTNVNTQFETFINKYLFPKLNETAVIDVPLGNRFDWLAKEIDFIGQYSEEYVIMDSVPSAMNLSKSEELMLKRNYPNMATKLYGMGVVKKQKFTLNNNDARQNFLTLADATGYALAVYHKKISDINVAEESEIKGMLVAYSLEHVKEKREVASQEDLFQKTFEGILNIQNNSAKYNEASLASGGQIGRYTTTTKLEDIIILTNDTMKTYLLNTKLANTFQVAGLDLSQRIMSFDDLGGNWKAKEDITITDTATLAKFKTMGDYQTAKDDIVPKDSIFTWDVSELTEFVDKVEEIKPPSELFAFVLDVNAIRYRRYTKGMLKVPFNNPEFDEVTHWIHYYSFKSVSPFYNKILITGK